MMPRDGVQFSCQELQTRGWNDLFIISEGIKEGVGKVFCTVPFLPLNPSYFKETEA